MTASPIPGRLSYIISRGFTRRRQARGRRKMEENATGRGEKKNFRVGKHADNDEQEGRTRRGEGRCTSSLRARRGVDRQFR